jgi:RNA polymerase-interacting CarD/CdnL/TRCF family regulator
MQVKENLRHALSFQEGSTNSSSLMAQSHPFTGASLTRDLALRVQLEHMQESQRRLIEAIHFAISGLTVVQDISDEHDIKRLAARIIRSLEEAIAAATRWRHDH